MRIAVVANSFWNINHYRKNLIKFLASHGHSIVVICPIDNDINTLQDEIGCQVVPISLLPSSTNPFREVVTIFMLLIALRKVNPDAVISFTPKGNIYSSMAASLLGINYIPNISGLGSVFVNQNYLTSLVRVLYKVVLSRAYCTFFQNNSDLEDFVAANFVVREKAHCLPGSGVDLSHFLPQPLRDKSSDELMFLLPARLLWDKGVGEYVEAARIVKRKFPLTRFCLVGFLNSDNPSAINERQIANWITEGIIEYLGASSDIRLQIAESDCIVLPSYREGMPKVLLEAGAMMRPIITSDAIGCRDAVSDGVTGFICKARDSFDLASKILAFIDLNFEKRSQLAQAARRRVEKEFDEKIVLATYGNALAELEKSLSKSKKTLNI